MPVVLDPICNDKRELCFARNKLKQCKLLNEAYPKNKKCPFYKKSTKEVRIESDPALIFCNDQRNCFAKSSSGKQCRILVNPGSYPKGKCPFYKPAESKKGGKKKKDDFI